MEHKTQADRSQYGCPGWRLGRPLPTGLWTRRRASDGGAGRGDVSRWDRWVGGVVEWAVYDPP